MIPEGQRTSLVRFSGAFTLWLLLSWLPFLVSDFDFKEAIHWAAQPVAIRNHVVLCTLEAVLFVILTAGIRRPWRAVGLLLLAFTFVGEASFSIHRFSMPPFTDAWDGLYLDFIARTYASHALQAFLHTTLAVLALIRGTQFVRQLYQLRRYRLSSQ